MITSYNENWDWEYDDDNQKIKFFESGTDKLILEVNYKQFKTMYKLIERNIKD